MTTTHFQSYELLRVKGVIEWGKHMERNEIS
jgi:hypothetical protein